MVSSWGRLNWDTGTEVISTLNYNTSIRCRSWFKLRDYFKVGRHANYISGVGIRGRVDTVTRHKGQWSLQSTVLSVCVDQFLLRLEIPGTGNGKRILSLDPHCTACALRQLDFSTMPGKSCYSVCTPARLFALRLIYASIGIFVGLTVCVIFPLRFNNKWEH